MNPWGTPPPPPATESAFFNAARATVFLLVEGGSDERFWRAHVDLRCCQVRSMNGREPAIAELRSNRKPGNFLAVLDADFDRINGTLQEDPDIIWTDLHDLECILIASPALDKVLIERGSREKLSQFENDGAGPIREALVSDARYLGRLRWLNQRDSLGLTFRKQKPKDGTFSFLSYRDICDKTTFRVVETAMVRTVLNFSQRHDLDPTELVERMASLPDVDLWQLNVGHDLIGILSVWLRKKLGNETLDIEEIERSIRLAFEAKYLKDTAMFRSIREWEAKNPRFRVFVAQF